jgi:hypothetical protein
MQYRDLMSIKAGCFIITKCVVRPKDFIDNIKNHYSEVATGRDLGFRISNEIPERVKADFDRYNYIIRKLIEISLYRETLKGCFK